MTRTRWAVLAALVVLVAAFFALDLQRHFTLENLQRSRAALVDYRNAHALLASGAFFALYVAVTALSVPGAIVLTLAAGAVFGFFWGLLLVSFASSLGATLAFLAARFVLGDFVQRRFGDRLHKINAGVRKDGAFYLLSLRLIPAFPFFVVNLVMALTPLPARTFYWVSQLGMLPGTAIFVYAGTELVKITSVRDVLSPTLIAALVLIGLFPLVARKVLEKIDARRRQA